MTNLKRKGKAGHSLLAHVEDSPTGTLQLIDASKSASFILSTVRAASNLLFALRVAYSKAATTPHWPTHLQARRGSDTDRRGRPPTKRGCRSPNARAGRDSRGGGSCSRSTLSAGQKSRRTDRYTISEGHKDKMDTEVEHLKTPT